MKTLPVYLVLSILLVGCGGGSDSDNTDSAPESNTTPNNSANSYPVASVFNNLYTKGINEVLYSRLLDQDWSIQYLLQPNNTLEEFQDELVRSSEINQSIYIDNAFSDSTNYKIYYTSAPFEILGFSQKGTQKEGDLFPTPNQIEIPIKTAIIPEFASIGDSGLIGTYELYDESQSVLYNTGTYTWSLTQASNDTAWVCRNNLKYEPYDYQTLDKSNVEDTECYEVNKSGEILGIKMTISAPYNYGADTIIFKSQ